MQVMSEAAGFRLGRRGSQTSLHLHEGTKHPLSLKTHPVLLCEATFSPSLLSKVVKRPRSKGAGEAEGLRAPAALAHSSPGSEHTLDPVSLFGGCLLSSPLPPTPDCTAMAQKEGSGCLLM